MNEDILDIEKYLFNIHKAINKACWNNYYNIRLSSTQARGEMWALVNC